MILAEIDLSDATLLLLLVLSFVAGAGTLGVIAYGRASKTAHRLLDLLDELTVEHQNLKSQTAEFKDTGDDDLSVP